MEPIRILLASMPRLMADIVAVGVRSQPDMCIVGTLDAVVELASEARRTRPDIVVLGLVGSDLPRVCGQLLAEHPEMRVLGIEHEDAEAGLYELRPRRVPLGVVSPTELADIIRIAARAPARLWEVC